MPPEANISELDQDPQTVTDDVHQVVADVRSIVAEALAPLKKVVATPYRLLGTNDLLVVVACIEAAAHVLINHIEGIVQPSPVAPEEAVDPTPPQPSEAEAAAVDIP